MHPFQRTLWVRRHHRKRIERRQKNSRPVRHAGWVLAGLVLVGIALLVVGFGTAAHQLIDNLPDVSSLPVLLDSETGSLLQPTRLYDRSGQHLLTSLETPGVERRLLPLDVNQPDSLSPALAQTAVMLFQPDYWEAPAFDPRQLTNERLPTIAERLVHNVLLPADPDQRLDTLRVRLLASQALERYGRVQVLEWYLNSASFGHQTFGADSAARLYLGKSASQLDWYDTALLIAAIETPALNPLDAPAAAHERQLAVLKRMASAGLISEADYELARSLPLVIPQKPAAEDTRFAGFTRLVLEQLTEDIDPQWLERGGLRIITTLDYELQEQLECTLSAQISRLAGESAAARSEACSAAAGLPPLPLTSSVRADSPQLAASGAVLDPLTGQVLALSGDKTLADGETGHNTHPSGSVQTPFLALAGFARGLSPASLVWDIPNSPEESANPSMSYHGPMRLRTALANDYLAGLDQVLQQVGSTALTTTTRSLGLSGYILPQEEHEVLSKGAKISPLEAAYAYIPFSTLGVQAGIDRAGDGKLSPQLVLAVESPGNRAIYEDTETATRPVINPQLAYLVLHVLADETARWPSLKHPNALELDRPAGAKTGSADEGRSTWAVGYTRQTVSAVWLGYAHEEPGAAPLDVSYAAGIWHALMAYRSQGLPIEGWEMPDGLVTREVCNPSGLLPTAECPSVVSELFVEGSEPTRSDDLYQRFAINRETGRLATVFTPPELVEERVFLVVPPEAQEWSRLAELPVPPQDYDTIQLPQTDPDVQIVSPAQFSYARGKVRVTGSAAGDIFTSYSLQIGKGINPPAWQTVGEASDTPVEYGLLGEIDFTGLDGLYVIRLQVIQTDRRVKTFHLQVTVDERPPEVTMPYPLPGQVFAGGVQRTITLQGKAEDNVGLERLEWWADGKKVGERREAPFALIWDAPVGKHTLQVRAYDLAGNEARTEEVTIEVR